MPDETPPTVLRDEDDPHLDWHSDARGTMDAFANDLAAREVTGTQVELLRRANAALPGALPEPAARACFDAYRARCAVTGSPSAFDSFETFVGWLQTRVMLRAVAGPDGAAGYTVTSVGRDFLRYLEEHALPERPL